MTENGKKDIIVIGASAGGFEAIQEIIGNLPADLQAAIFIVWHMSPNVRGLLPEVLNKKNTLKAAHAVDNEPIQHGRVYVAPPDHHLMIQKEFVRITKGPKENRFRPAVDPLFRSAAYYCGGRTTGIVLSGALDDGTAGLWTIKQCGGTAIVQDPSDAEVPSMPENALKAVEADHVLPVSEIAPLLVNLVNQAPQQKEIDMKDQKRTEMEVRVALEDQAYAKELFSQGELTPYTCPECHGVLSSFQEGGRIRFRCHTGHAFSADALLASITQVIEESLWNAVRNVQESILLLNHMGDHFAEVNQPKLAAMFFRKAQEAEQRAIQVRQAVINHEQLTIDGIRQQTDTNSGQTVS